MRIDAVSFSIFFRFVIDWWFRPQNSMPWILFDRYAVNAVVRAAGSR